MKPNWFAALPVSAHGWLPHVLRNLPSSCRAFHADDMHMTVAFFGAMPDSRVADIVAILDQIRAASIPLRLGPLLTLPTPKRVSAFSFSVAEGRERAASLIGRWRGPLLEAARARPDHRPPLPHLTVARLSRKASGPERAAALEWARKAKPPGDWLMLDHIALYTWADDRRSRQFKRVHQRKLDA